MNQTNAPKNPQEPAEEIKTTGLVQAESMPDEDSSDELSEDQLTSVAGGRPKGPKVTTNSDIRLKHDIETVGKAGDLTLYRFKYIDDASNTDWVGVMAQDLLEHPQHKDAVVTAESGYYQVDYAALGIEMVGYTDWLKQTRH